MKIDSLFLVLVVLATLSQKAQADADPSDPYRRNLANETFEFLRTHCLVSEDDPLQWVYVGCYDMSRAAREIYSTKALKDIEMPVSEYKRGGYSPYLNPLVFLQHESLTWRIYVLLNYGKTGIPKPELTDAGSKRAER